MITANLQFPKLHQLPITMPADGAISIRLERGIPLFRASSVVQTRIGRLLEKQREAQLSVDEERELDQYEAVDDYLSYLNRLIRNLQLQEV